MIKSKMMKLNKTLEIPNELFVLFNNYYYRAVSAFNQNQTLRNSEVLVNWPINRPGLGLLKNECVIWVVY